MDNHSFFGFILRAEFLIARLYFVYSDRVGCQKAAEVLHTNRSVIFGAEVQVMPEATIGGNVIIGCGCAEVKDTEKIIS